MAEPGRLIGPYRLLSVLGRGAMGEVWRARDERLDRLVALKLLPRDEQASPQRRARMAREAKAAAAIPHRNVVTLFDIVSEDGEDVLIMELVEGKTLAELVAAGGPLPTARAVAILVELCDALAAAHERGVLHRDIKAANVMVTDEGAVRVLDFGLAKLLGPGEESIEEPIAAARRQPRPSQIALDETVDSVDRRVSATMPAMSAPGAGADPLVTQAGQLLGTPLYMAPEQLAGEAPTESSEVFSVGVLAYELVAGAPPFAGASFDELQVKVLNEEPPPLPARVDRELAAIIEQALAKDPEQRFSDMATLRDRIASVQRRLEAPPGRRWPTAILAAAAALAVAVAASVGGREDAAAPAETAVRPGEEYVDQALREYNLFYNQKAAASLRAAARVAPDHPLVPAYSILFGVATGAELDRAAAEARRLRRLEDLDERERALLDAAIALASVGPAAARAALGIGADEGGGELAFWDAELAYRAGDYGAAEEAFRAVLAGAPAFRGRVYDHFSAVLSYRGRSDEALSIGRRYAEAFAGEPDAIGVYATTLARAGRLDEALVQAEEARRLYEGEDTVAGLAKVRALRGELAEARRLYRKATAMAPAERRPLRRAAFAYLAWIEGDDAEARREIAVCLPGGEDDAIWQRGPCLWVAGVIWPEKTAEAIAELDALAAAATSLRPAYGIPGHLADTLRARQIHFAGACRRPQPETEITEADRRRALELLSRDRDFFADYHLPFFSEYVRCEREALE
jgi:tetratricopeptide (TPR) repeat protein/predicted Ser/Thr protein kinase